MSIEFIEDPCYNLLLNMGSHNDHKLVTQRRACISKERIDFVWLHCAAALAPLQHFILGWEGLHDRQEQGRSEIHVRHCCIRSSHLNTHTQGGWEGKYDVATRKVGFSRETCKGNVGIMDTSYIFRFLLLFMFVANRARLVVGCVCVNQSKKCFVD